MNPDEKIEQSVNDNMPMHAVDPISKGTLVNTVTVDRVDEDGIKHMSDGTVDNTDKREMEGGALQRKNADGSEPTADEKSDADMLLESGKQTSDDRAEIIERQQTGETPTES